jgi:hypothetical protein
MSPSNHPSSHQHTWSSHCLPPRLIPSDEGLQYWLRQLLKHQLVPSLQCHTCSSNTLPNPPLHSSASHPGRLWTALGSSHEYARPSLPRALTANYTPVTASDAGQPQPQQPPVTHPMKFNTSAAGAVMHTNCTLNPRLPIFSTFPLFFTGPDSQLRLPDLLSFPPLLSGLSPALPRPGKRPTELALAPQKPTNNNQSRLFLNSESRRLEMDARCDLQSANQARSTATIKALNFSTEDTAAFVTRRFFSPPLRIYTIPI